MNIIFQKTNAYWAKYSEYEYCKGTDGLLYIKATPDAKPSVYDPMKIADALVVDALNVGRLAMKQGNKKMLKSAVMDFVTKYGLLGFMPALPTTSDFVNYDAVYLPKNKFIKAETMNTQDYLAYYFPFNKPDIHKGETQSRWDVSSADYSREVLALAGTFMYEPFPVGMSLLPIYAEQFDWLISQFQDWAFMLVSTFLFYEEKDRLDDNTKSLFRQSVPAFGEKAPTYHIALYDDKPKIVWDFHSLLLTIQTLIGFALTDEDNPLRICKHCSMAFIAKHPESLYCNEKCKNQYNVYKSRGKKKKDS